MKSKGAGGDSNAGEGRRRGKRQLLGVGKEVAAVQAREGGDDCF